MENSSDFSRDLITAERELNKVAAQSRNVFGVSGTTMLGAEHLRGVGGGGGNSSLLKQGGKILFD